MSSTLSLKCALLLACTGVRIGLHRHVIDIALRGIGRIGLQNRRKTTAEPERRRAWIATKLYSSSFDSATAEPQ